MRDLYFASIIDSLGEATTSRYVSPEYIVRWKTILPDNLLNCWVNEGWSRYQYGLFSLVEKYGGLNENEIYCFDPIIQKLETLNFNASNKVNAIDYLLELRKIITPVIKFI
ncbi:MULTISPECIES: GAD-like domain-containing protein [Providencia]|uniref:GAD-like domain-containing protein n=2 Tax=Providencia TaxID=586 RepID=A0A264VXY3_PRORE|nr:MULTISPECIES: GAD-like domain-containing protein [Providencia]MBJ9970477.1 hypothetical protein [Providencia rettgeri]MBN6365285.1 hypothetical protein [Providencia rettgeri]MCF8962081.1 hypothetical protein [Providencia rettgeri]MCL0009992.1 hypothetical protein [Providencia rettgeri]MDH2377750.1 GAD-like domain-containing protein [Providencia rettgeri]